MKFTERAKVQGGGDGSMLYVRLKDGESINIIPRGEIHEFYSVFGTRGEVTSQTPGAKLRYKVNVIVNDAGTMKSKVLEFGQTVYDQLAEMNKVCDVTKTKLRFSRKGSTKSDTVYMLLPVINEPLGPKTVEALDKIQLNILDGKANENQSQVEHKFPPESGSSEDHPEIPF